MAGGGRRSSRSVSPSFGESGEGKPRRRSLLGPAHGNTNTQRQSLQSRGKMASRSGPRSRGMTKSKSESFLPPCKCTVISRRKKKKRKPPFRPSLFSSHCTVLWYTMLRIAMFNPIHPASFSVSTHACAQNQSRPHLPLAVLFCMASIIYSSTFPFLLHIHAKKTWMCIWVFGSVCT